MCCTHMGNFGCSYGKAMRSFYSDLEVSGLKEVLFNGVQQDRVPLVG